VSIPSYATPRRNSGDAPAERDTASASADRAQPSAVSVVDGEASIGGRVIWRDVDIDIARGEFAAILGPNGSGKTTLLRVILGELPLARGSVSVLGDPPGTDKRRIGYLPQRRHFEPGTRIRGIDLVRLGLDGARWGLPLRRTGGEPVERVLRLVGAEAYARRAIGSLSGGEQQRLLIAQALVSDPQLLILDEPLDSLDLPNQSAVATLLSRVSREHGVTVLLVAHDVNPLLAHLDRVVYFGGGRAVVGDPREVIEAGVLSRLYGVPVEVIETADGRLVVVGAPEAPAHHSDRHGHRHGHGHGHA
jgi:zinc/manganese transport system ATP-binding protein